MTYTEKMISNIQTRILYEIVTKDEGERYVAAALDGKDLRELMRFFGINTDECSVIIRCENMPVRFIDYTKVSDENLIGELTRRGWEGKLEHQKTKRIIEIEHT